MGGLFLIPHPKNPQYTFWSIFFQTIFLHIWFLRVCNDGLFIACLLGSSKDVTWLLPLTLLLPFPWSSWSDLSKIQVRLCHCSAVNPTKASHFKQNKMQTLIQSPTQSSPCLPLRLISSPSLLAHSIPAILAFLLSPTYSLLFFPTKTSAQGLGLCSLLEP